MRKLALLLVGLVLFSVPSLAGAYLMNDTGQTVYGLQVIFSEPVRITTFGDVLTKVDPTGESTEFTFTGGEVSTSGGHWLNWAPATAKLVSSEWITPKASPSSSSSTTGNASMGFPTTPDVPSISGDLLNPAYFGGGMRLTSCRELKSTTGSSQCRFSACLK